MFIYISVFTFLKKKEDLNSDALILPPPFSPASSLNSENTFTKEHLLERSYFFIHAPSKDSDIGEGTTESSHPPSLITFCKKKGMDYQEALRKQGSSVRPD